MGCVIAGDPVKVALGVEGGCVNLARLLEGVVLVGFG